MRPTDPAELLQLRADAGKIELLIGCVGEQVRVDVAVPPAVGHAMLHLFALHSHDRACPAAPKVHSDLLRRCLEATDAAPATVIVRTGPRPAFRLRLHRQGAPVEVDVGVLDAFWLLADLRLEVELERHDSLDDWNRALQQLVDPP